MEIVDPFVCVIKGICRCVSDSRDIEVCIKRIWKCGDGD